MAEDTLLKTVNELNVNSLWQEGNIRETHGIKQFHRNVI